MGFFYNEQSKRRGKSHVAKGRISVDAISILHTERCNACPLDKERLLHPKMDPTGSNTPVVYMLGEAPGAEEDERGEQFIGDAGRLLRPEIPKRWRGKIRWNNTLRCRPPKNRDPLPVETECCRQFIVEDIQRTKPKAIFGFGNVPLRWVTGSAGIGLWRGRRVAVQVGTHKCWFFPMHHPAYISRIQGRQQSELNEEVERNFYRDIDRAFEFLERDYFEPRVESEGYLDNIEWVFGSGDRDYSKVQAWLDELRSNKLNAVDIETQNLRPYGKGSAMLTAAVGTYDKTYAFPLDHPNAWGLRLRNKVLGLFEEFLYDAATLVVQKLEFEQEWFAWYYGLELLEYRFGKWEDTLSASYVLDMRKGMHNLGTITQRFLGFDVKSLSPAMNMANMVDEPLEKVLPYNGLDTKYTELVWHLLDAEMGLKDNKCVRPAYEYHADLTTAIVAAQFLGVRPNHKELASIDLDLSAKAASIEKRIQADKDVKLFVKKYGSFDPASATKDLLIFFRDFLRVAEGRSHKNKQGYTTDDKMLEKIKHKVPVARLLQQLRTVTKNKSNYIDGTLKHIDPDGRIHTNYTHTYTSTTRLSSENPNLQNYPARKDHYIRAVIGADEDCKLVAFDYGQIDARNIAMYSGDRYYMEALFKNYDIHMEWANKIVDAYPKVLDITIERYGLDKKIDEEDLIKQFRSLSVKNEWTFPLFYGADADQVAGHVKVPSRHIRPLFDEFWDTFSGVKEWQEEIIETYKQDGYVMSLNGHRMHGPLKINELLNRPIQCATAEIVGDAMVRTGLEGWWCNMQIHDDLTFNVPYDNDFDRNIEKIAKIMCLVPFDWITVPIVVEAKVGNNWHEMEAYGDFNSEEYR